jgi:hypothetical protein
MLPIRSRSSGIQDRSNIDQTSKGSSIRVYGSCQDVEERVVRCIDAVRMRNLDLYDRPGCVSGCTSAGEPQTAVGDCCCLFTELVPSGQRSEKTFSLCCLTGVCVAKDGWVTIEAHMVFDKEDSLDDRIRE